MRHARCDTSRIVTLPRRQIQISALPQQRCVRVELEVFLLGNPVLKAAIDLPIHGHQEPGNQLRAAT